MSKERVLPESRVAISTGFWSAEPGGGRVILRPVQTSNSGLFCRDPGGTDTAPAAHAGPVLTGSPRSLPVSLHPVCRSQAFPLQR